MLDRGSLGKPLIPLIQRGLCAGAKWVNERFKLLNRRNLSSKEELRATAIAVVSKLLGLQKMVLASWTWRCQTKSPVKVVRPVKMATQIKQPNGNHPTARRSTFDLTVRYWKLWGTISLTWKELQQYLTKGKRLHAEGDSGNWIWVRGSRAR